MKLRAESIRKKLDTKIQEKELKEQEELRLKKEDQKRKIELEKERKQLELTRLSDLKILESLALDSALEGKFQVEVNFDDLEYYNDENEFDLLDEFGFEITSSESIPISNIRSFVLTSENDVLEEVELLLTKRLNEFVEICKTKNIFDILTLLSSYKKNDDIKVNVEKLTLLLKISSDRLKEYLDGNESDLDSDDENSSDPINWPLKIRSQIDFFEEDLEIYDLDDPTCPVTYEQFFLSWKKKGKSFTEEQTLFEAKNFNWIASKNGQLFFHNIQKAIDKCVNDLSSSLTLHLSLKKSQISIIIDSDEVFDSDTTEDDESSQIKNYYFNCPLSLSNLVKVFEHLNFTTGLYQVDEDHPNSFTLEILW